MTEHVDQEPVKRRPPATPGQALLAIAFVFVLGLVVGFVLGKTV